MFCGPSTVSGPQNILFPSVSVNKCYLTMAVCDMSIIILIFHSLVERRYKQMLEEEQRSLARNKSLLEDIDRLEEQIQLFSNECKQDEEKLKHAKV